MISDSVLLLRALNYQQRQHTVGYAALRMLAESIGPKYRGRWVSDFVRNKGLTGRKQLYWKYSLFKQTTDGKPEYRVCIASSPSSHLAESWLVSRLLLDDSFVPPRHVYSYLPPMTTRARHQFRHFFEGYRRRESDIHTALVANDDAIAVVLDLRQFYPTINTNRLMESVMPRIAASSLAKPEQRIARFLVEELLSIPHVSGVPIGPCLSHVLANTYLYDIDREMNELFPQRYFRYVDDVVIVCNQNESQHAVESFRRVVGRLGLRVNESKTDFVKATGWHSKTKQSDIDSLSQSFDGLVRRLQFFLARHPDAFSGLLDEMRGRGFMLPLHRLKPVAASAGFWRLIAYMWSLSSWSERYHFVTDSAVTLVNVAEDVRRSFVAAFQESWPRQFSEGGMERRWQIQRIKFFANRMLALGAAATVEQRIQSIPDLPEVDETKAVVDAIASRNATRLLRYPGPATVLFSQLWKEGKSEQPRMEWGAVGAKEERDSATTLGAFGVCTIPESWQSQFEGSNRAILACVSDRLAQAEDFSETGFVAESISLRRHSGNTWADILMSRYSDYEDVSIASLFYGIDPAGLFGRWL